MKKEKNDPYERYLFSDRPPWKPTTLKQKALWVSALVFWLIAACTLFAVKNQELMTPQVTTVSAENSYSSGSPAKLPLDCLQIDGDGGMHLYEIYEGTGWEAGVRVREVQGFSLDESNVLLGNGGWGDYVQYASKTLTDGELVEVIQGGEKAADQWLAVFPEDAPEPDHLPSGVEIVARDGNALLLSVESDQQPFMEGRAKNLVPELSEARVYSLSAMEQFQGNFICTGLLLMVFVIVFWMWGYAWYENQLSKKYPRMWPMSVGISIYNGVVFFESFVINTQINFIQNLQIKPDVGNPAFLFIFLTIIKLFTIVPNHLLLRDSQLVVLIVGKRRQPVPYVVYHRDCREGHMWPTGEHILPFHILRRRMFNIGLPKGCSSNCICHRQQKLPFFCFSCLHHHRGQLIPLHELCIFYIAVQRQEHISFHCLLGKFEQRLGLDISATIVRFVALCLHVITGAGPAHKDVRASAGHHFCTQTGQIYVPLVLPDRSYLDLNRGRPTHIRYLVLKADTFPFSVDIFLAIVRKLVLEPKIYIASIFDIDEDLQRGRILLFCGIFFGVIR